MNRANTFQCPVEPELVARLQRGELAAFERIYRDYERATYTLALRLTGHVDTAHEVMQDAMLKAWQRAAQYRGDAPFGAWMRRLVVNESLMRMRRERVRASEPFEDVHVDDSSPVPWHLVDAATLDAALAQLPDCARAVLWLYHVEGCTHVEIAEQFGRSVSFSKSQLARGTHRLRQLLQPTTEATPCLNGLATSP